MLYQILTDASFQISSHLVFTTSHHTEIQFQFGNCNKRNKNTSRWTTKRQVSEISYQSLNLHSQLPKLHPTGTRKLFLKPASFQSIQNEQNGNSSENGSAASQTVNNPFLRCDRDEPEATKSDEKNNEHEKDPEKQTTNNLFKPVANLFANSASSLSENSNFVFGQNLRERVVMVSGTLDASNYLNPHF